MFCFRSLHSESPSENRLNRHGEYLTEILTMFHIWIVIVFTFLFPLFFFYFFAILHIWLIFFLFHFQMKLYRHNFSIFMRIMQEWKEKENDWRFICNQKSLTKCIKYLFLFDVYNQHLSESLNFIGILCQSCLIELLDFSFVLNDFQLVFWLDMPFNGFFFLRCICKWVSEWERYGIMCA